MKAPPLLFGGRSPVVAYLRHSMIVYESNSINRLIYEVRDVRTVFPDPLQPTIRVKGV